MAEDTRNPAVTGEVSGDATGGAALIATFYGPRNNVRIRALRELFDEYFGSQAVLCFDLPEQVAHDATVLQLGMNAPGDDAAANAWKGLWRKLEGILDAEDLEGIWGYTLVYQAVVEEGYDADAVSEHVLPAARRLHSVPAVRRLHSGGGPAPIRTFKVAGGRAWLLGVPGPVGGPDAGMVYVTLGPREGEKALLEQFYSISARYVADLLPPDLIAHKGYFQMRQYRTGDLELRYQQSLKNLQETTGHLLEDLRNSGASADHPLEDLQEGSGGPDRLDKLFRLYCRLLPVASRLKELQVGMLQQSENLDKWRSQFGDNEALEFHQDHINNAIRELESKVEPLQFDLEIADKAVSTARLQMEKEQEERNKEQEERNREAERREERQRRKDEKKEDLEQRRQEKIRLKQERDEARNQQRMQTWLAAGAAALAGVELVDRDVAGLLLGRIPILQSFEGNALAELGARVFVVALFATLIYLLVHRLLRRPRDFTIRPARMADERFLWQMLAESAHEPTVQDVKANPDVAKYVEDWDGHYDDLGFVAESSDGELLGAAWQRLFTRENKGFGYVDDQTPELVIAVLQEHRDGGIGAELLGRLLDESARRSYPAVSLSVSTDNHALRLYKREGFEVVEGSEAANRAGATSVTMRVALDRVAPEASVTADAGTSSHTSLHGPPADSSPPERSAARQSRVRLE